MGASEESGDSGSDGRAEPDGVLARARSIGVVRAVVAITVLAIAVRLVFLGARAFHWDEARVGYWILHSIDSGSFHYRRIIHGPLIQHVHRVLVPLFGTSDAFLRLPVALVGGLLPLTALLFREHLEDDETVVLALFLAFNAVLLYYSRFMRSDMLVAAFMFAALGLVVRLYDTRRPRYLYGLAVLVALGFGSKENAVVYVLTWIGATALLADQALYRPREADSGLDLLREKWRRTEFVSYSNGRWLFHLLGAVVVFLAVIVFLYGDRGAGSVGLHYPPVGPDAGGLGLYEALTQPTAFPEYAVDTLTHTYDEFMHWINQSSTPGCHADNVIDGWICFLGQFLEVMGLYAPVLSVFAVGGFVLERFGRERGRNLVMFAAYAGLVSVVGYPLGTDVFGAWIVVHALVPLAIPAAVGIAAVSRFVREDTAGRDDVDVALAWVVLVAIALVAAYPAATGVYADHSAEGNHLVQYAQPADDLDPVAAAFERAAGEDGPGSDVVFFYGETDDRYDDHQAIVEETPPDLDENILLGHPYCARWYNALPLPWYYRVADANVTCERSPRALMDTVQDEPPGVVVTMRSDGTVPDRELRSFGYESATFRMRTNNYRTTVFVHERLGGIQGPVDGGGNDTTSPTPSSNP